MDALRSRLKALFDERSDHTNYKKASLAIGRNAAYIYQFIFKGVPKKLDEDDRKKLAAHLGVEERELMDPKKRSVTMESYHQPSGFHISDFVQIPAYDIHASAGHGAVVNHEAILYYLSFRKEWLKAISNAPLDKLSVIRVDGDSMEPTLSHDDTVLVDMTQTTPQRDGIYVVLYDSVLLVKRLRMDPSRGTLAIVSDNPAYPPVEKVKTDELRVAGKVLWLGRRV